MADTSVVFDVLAKDKASSVFSKIAGVASSMFSALTGAAVGGLAYAKDAVEAASNLAETQSKVNVLFGEGAGALNTWASSAASSIGQSKQQALDAAATFGVFAQSAGLSGTQAVNFSTDMTKLASDMASFSNTTPQQAIDALGAALRGESEPIRAYGVLLDDATLRNEALKMGLIKTTSQALTPQQKVLAAQAAIMKQTTAAQGDFARTADGAANKQRIQAAEMANLKTQIGVGLLPVYNQMLNLTKGFVEWGGKNTTAVKAIGIAVGVLAGAYALFVVVQKIQTAVQWAQNAAWLASPITWIVLGILLLIGVIILIATKTTWFQQIWDAVWGWIKGAALAVADWFAGPFKDFFVNAFNFIKGLVVGYFNFWVGIWNAIIGFVAAAPGRISQVASGMWDGIKNAFKGAINWIIGKWNGLRFTIPAVHFLGFSSPSFTLGVPAIPYLASGGVITQTGLAVVHRNETVVPAQARPLTGVGGTPTLRVAGNGDSALATFLHALQRQGILQFAIEEG